MAARRMREILEGLRKLCEKELKTIDETGFVSNYNRIANVLSTQSNSVLVIGRCHDFQKETNQRNYGLMKLKLNRDLRAKLIQLAAFLLADASDGALDSADQVSTSMIALGQEIRRQNGLPPLTL